jgi:hypothetical protein
MRLGIDVGGTNTDAVLISGRTVLATAKRLTTPDVSSGIIVATRAVLEAVHSSPAAIESVMIGTTHFANAFVERRGLLEVAVLRLAGSSGEALPPFSGWPRDLRRCLGDLHFQLAGGYEFDGREIAALDEAAIRDAARRTRQAGVKSMAIFAAPIIRDGRARRGDRRRGGAGDLVTASSALGRIGFPSAKRNHHQRGARGACRTWSPPSARHSRSWAFAPPCS